MIHHSTKGGSIHKTTVLVNFTTTSKYTKLYNTIVYSHCIRTCEYKPLTVYHGCRCQIYNRCQIYCQYTISFNNFTYNRNCLHDDLDNMHEISCTPTNIPSLVNVANVLQTNMSHTIPKFSLHFRPTSTHAVQTKKFKQAKMPQQHLR